MQRKSLLTKVKRYIVKEKLFDLTDTLLLAISGGVDSMTMLHILRELGYEVLVSHVNYRLRGVNSSLDKDLVQIVCQDFNIPYHEYTITDLEAADLKNGNLQEKARNIRYQFFAKIMAETSIPYCCTAHHLNDQAETVLYRLIKKSGIKGLLGIASKNNEFRRPLLCLSKSEILQYADSEGLRWRDDASNANNDYDRNFIRNEILNPLLAKWPESAYNISQSAAILSDENLLLDYTVNNIAAKHLVQKDGYTSLINLSRLTEIPGSRSLLYKILEPYAFFIQQIDDILNGAAVGSIFESKSHELLIDRDSLIIRPIKDDNNSVKSVEIQKHEHQIPFGLKALTITEVERSNFESDPNIEFIDAQKVGWPITLRIVEQGDRIQPIGMNGKSKMVSDILIDVKMNTFKKSEQPVLCDQNSIIWLVGVRMDERFKITDSTETILRLEWI